MLPSRLPQAHSDPKGSTLKKVTPFRPDLKDAAGLQLLKRRGDTVRREVNKAALCLLLAMKLGRCKVKCERSFGANCMDVSVFVYDSSVKKQRSARTSGGLGKDKGV
jgi:hypothetical protein